MLSTCQTHVFVLDLVTLDILVFGEGMLVMKLLSVQLLQAPINSYLWDPNIFLSVMLWNIISMCSSIKVRTSVLHSYETTANIVLMLPDIKWEYEIYAQI